MEFKINSSEKTTEYSSNQSATSEQIKINQNQSKNFSDNTLKEEKKENNHFINSVRKYSIEPQIFRKEFVPVLKPIEIHLVPSKLKLNEMEFKHKKNKKNKDFFSCLSCPCSEEGSEINSDLDLSSSLDISEISDLSKNINNTNDEKGLNAIRKKFSKIKFGSIQKVKTNKNLKKKLTSKQFECFNIYDNDNKEEEDNNLYNDKIEENENRFSSELYEENNNFNNYSMKPYEGNNLDLKKIKSSKIITNSIKHYDNLFNKDNLQNNDNNNAHNMEDVNQKKRNRIYSFSILDTLKNKLKIDK